MVQYRLVEFQQLRVKSFHFETPLNSLTWTSRLHWVDQLPKLCSSIFPKTMFYEASSKSSQKIIPDSACQKEIISESNEEILNKFTVWERF